MTGLRQLDQRWFVGAWLGGHGFELGATDEADAPEQGSAHADPAGTATHQARKAGGRWFTEVSA